MDYISKADLVAKFGIAWATDEEFDLYADLVNAWLYGRGIPQDLTAAEDLECVRKASFFLARAAKEDALYVDTDNVKARKGSAQQGTSFEVQYEAHQNVMNRWVKIALDLLSNFISEKYVFLIDKIN